MKGEEAQGTFHVETPKRALRPGQSGAWLKREMAANLPGLLRRFLEEPSPKVMTQLKVVMETLGIRGEEPKKKGKSVVARLLEEVWEDEPGEKGHDSDSRGSDRRGYDKKKSNGTGSTRPRTAGGRFASYASAMTPPQGGEDCESFGG